MIGVGSHPWLGGFLGDPQLVAIFEPGAELERYLKVEAAWTRALGTVEGQDTDTVASAIIDAPISAQDLAEGMAKDGVAIPALVELLRQHLGPESAAHLHRGLTSQDVIDTSLVLALQQVLDVLAERVRTLDAVLDTAQRTFGGHKLPAYTRLQPALNTTGRAVIDRWRSPFQTIGGDISDVCKRVGVIQWGGPTGARDLAHADALGATLAKNLGLSDPGQPWHTDRGNLVEFAHLLTQICIATGKLGEDIALYAITGHITCRGGGSSSMPHKNNPVTAEALIALSDYAATLSSAINRSARHEGFRSGQAWILEWLTLPQLCVVTGAGTRLALQLIDDIVELGSD